MSYPLKYLKNLPMYHEVQPYELYGFPHADSESRTNFEYETIDTPIEDARGIEKSFNFDNAGFFFLKHTSACPLEAQHFESAEAGNPVIDSYLEECKQLVIKLLKPRQLYIMDWRFRRNEREQLNVRPLRSRARPIGSTMHCDYSYDGGADRLQMHLLPHELEEIDNEHLIPMIINVWRPFRTIDNAPLLLCDRQSVRKGDLVEVDKVLADKVEKAFYLFHREGQRWLALSNQRADEVLVFKTWTKDSGDSFADCAPHGAPVQELDGKRPRESIEVRMIVLFAAE